MTRDGNVGMDPVGDAAWRQWWWGRLQVRPRPGMNKIREWLGGLALARAQPLSISRGAALRRVIYFAIVPARSLGGKTARSARRQQKSADLAWMREVAPQVMAAAAAGGGTAGSESLVVLVDRTGREAGLGNAIRDQSPDGEHGLRLQLRVHRSTCSWRGSRVCSSSTA